MFYFILIVIVVVILFFILRKNKKEESPEKIQKNETTSTDELLILNISIRKNLLDQCLIDNIERIIDKLKDILPILEENYQTSELTWVANKMATDYLQKVIIPYIHLEKKEQINKKSSLIDSLNQIENELDEIISLVNEKKTSGFDTKAKFIKNRFQ